MQRVRVPWKSARLLVRYCWWFKSTLAHQDDGRSRRAFSLNRMFGDSIAPASTKQMVLRGLPCSHRIAEKLRQIMGAVSGLRRSLARILTRRVRFPRPPPVSDYVARHYIIYLEANKECTVIRVTGSEFDSHRGLY